MVKGRDAEQRGWGGAEYMKIKPEETIIRRCNTQEQTHS